MKNRYSESCREYIYVGVGTWKDSKLKLMDVHVSHTLGWFGELEHLKIATRLIGESFEL
jgi:hypothetical protein